jgi:GNAT superfamily N-acetyltransferase
MTCNVCYALRDPLASWCLVDPAVQHSETNAPCEGLAIVRVPPAEPRGGVGRLQLRIGGETLADLDLAICGPCRRAVLEQVRVDEGHRRFGYGRVLVAAALALAPPAEYSWSSTTVNRDDVVVQAFWSCIDWPGALGEPNYCSDMERAAGRLPDW